MWDILAWKKNVKFEFLKNESLVLSLNKKNIIYSKMVEILLYENMVNSHSNKSWTHHMINHVFYIILNVIKKSMYFFIFYSFTRHQLLFN